MCPISNSSRSVSDSSSSWEAGDIESPFTGKAAFKALSDKANSIPLMRIFRYYGIRINEVNKIIICPFKNHKGGRENTASFQFYPETNTFWCHGCKTGTMPAIFVANMENITYSKAVNKILEQFSEDIDDGSIFEQQEDFSERLEIMMDFSTAVRAVYQKSLSDKEFAQIEEVCKSYDYMNLKCDLSNEALRDFVDKLKQVILAYHG